MRRRATASSTARIVAGLGRRRLARGIDRPGCTRPEPETLRLRDLVGTTWIGGGIGLRGVRAPLAGANTLVQWSACPRVELWGVKAEAESTNGCVPTASPSDQARSDLSISVDS